jgi:hypothetical protein
MWTKMKLLLILLPLFIDHIKSHDDSTFQKWKKFHGTEFKSQIEIKNCTRIFTDHKIEVEAHNVNQQVTYKMALNLFSNLTSDEFIRSRCRMTVPKDLIKMIAANKSISERSSMKSTTVSVIILQQMHQVWSTFAT